MNRVNASHRIIIILSFASCLYRDRAYYTPASPFVHFVTPEKQSGRVKQNTLNWVFKLRHTAAHHRPVELARHEIEEGAAPYRQQQQTWSLFVLSVLLSISIYRFVVLILLTNSDAPYERPRPIMPRMRSAIALGTQLRFLGPARAAIKHAISTQPTLPP